jgi:hypothetical protein
MRLRHLVLLSALICLPARAERLRVGDWIGSAGLGFMSSPALLLISPHLERVYKPGMFLGGLMQAGFGGGEALFTITFTARYQLGEHPRLRPLLEGGAGIASGTKGFSSSFGIALHVGMGVDYLLAPDLALSSIVRACFAPPLSGFFLSWPFVQLRYLF